SAQVRHRSARRLRHGHRALRSVDVRPGAYPGNHRIPQNAVPLKTVSAHSQISIIGAPLDLGQSRRGVDMGPSAVRVANLNSRVASLGYAVEDLGNVPVDQAE